MCEPWKPRNGFPRVKRICGTVGSAEPLCWRDSHPLERQLASLHNISGFQAAHPVPLPRSRIPAEPTTPCHRRVGVVDAAPAPLEAKASACRDIGTNAGLQYLLSTLHGGCCHCPCKNLEVYARSRTRSQPLAPSVNATSHKP